jgi:hypothetical protein
MTNGVQSQADIVDDATLLTFDGVLNGDSYRTVRDIIVKAALDEPRAVLVEITQLQIPSESALSVFTSARWQITRWPDTPLALVCRTLKGRKALESNGITRYVPVHSSVAEALDALSHCTPTIRHRRRAELSRESVTLDGVRELIHDWLNELSRTDVLAVAKIVATVLIENALEHTTGGPTSLRLEAKDDAITIAVADTSAAPPTFRETVLGDTELTGLKILDAVSRTWSFSQTPGGKVVWCVLAPPPTIRHSAPVADRHRPHRIVDGRRTYAGCCRQRNGR